MRWVPPFGGPFLLDGSMNRRRFLAGGCALLGTAPALGRTLGGGFGFSDSFSNGLDTQYKVLEVFLDGGLSFAEALWHVDGAVPGWTEEADWDAIDGTNRTAWDWDGYLLGAATNPLSTYSDKFRLVTMAHDQFPHPGAVPLSVTGKTLGRARMAGMGAPIERFFSTDAVPKSWVFYDSGGDRAAGHAAATGLHGAENRPMVMRTSISESADDIISELGEARYGPGDALSASLRSRFEADLAHREQMVRSAAYDAYAGASNRSWGAPSIASQLSGTSLKTVGDITYLNNNTRTALRAAAHVLSQNGRYAMVVDDGVVHDYDTHTASGLSQLEYATCQAGNLWNVLDELHALIQDNTIDLSTTMVVLNTDFGRIDAKDANGTEHHQHGYCALLLGGPIDGVLGNPGVSGSFNNEDDLIPDPTSVGNPASLRAAMLLAAGIDPFHADCFDPQDMGSAETDPSALYDELRLQFLGVS
jgi:hypothetical protein